MSVNQWALDSPGFGDEMEGEKGELNDKPVVQNFNFF